jgi:hypothetical protein
LNDDVDSLIGVTEHLPFAKLPWGHTSEGFGPHQGSSHPRVVPAGSARIRLEQDVLVLQIKSRLHEREGKALANFQRELPAPESDMAEQVLKDPYNFDFLTVTEAAKERVPAVRDRE